MLALILRIRHIIGMITKNASMGIKALTRLEDNKSVIIVPKRQISIGRAPAGIVGLCRPLLRSPSDRVV
jgi:hypothetical protein